MGLERVITVTSLIRRPGHILLFTMAKIISSSSSNVNLVTNNFCINKCNRCLTCKYSLLTDLTFTSNTNHHTYSVITNSNLSCTSKNVIYLISCNICNLQYIGQTKQCLRDRLNGHRNKIKQNLLKTPIVSHFNLPNHTFDNLKIQFIENVLDESIILERELFWIKTLQTISPFGLNDNISGFGNVSMLGTETAPHFSAPFNVIRKVRSHGHRKPKSKNNKSFVDLYNLLLQTDGTFKLRVFLFGLSLSNLKLLNDTLGKITTTFNYNEKRCSGIIKAIAYFRLYKPVQTIAINNAKRLYLNLKFHNKGFDHINLSSIFYSKCVTNLIPPNFKLQEPPLISYRLTKPIRSTILNYRQTLENFSIYKTIPACECSFSSYIYSPIGHVITGDLNFIQNNEVKQLFSKGPNYREPTFINWKLCQDEIFRALDKFIIKWCRSEKAPKNSLTPWVKHIKYLVTRRICNLKSRFYYTSESVLNKSHVQSYILDLHKNYVVTVADKAANNLVFICKHYYLNVLCNELNYFHNNTSNTTYQLINTDLNTIINKHKNYLNSLPNISTCNFNKYNSDNLPFIYWIPKLHKNPYKARFITSAKKCSTTGLSVFITEGLKLIRTFWKNYSNVIFRNSGINYFWSINDSFSFVKKLIAIPKVNSISTFDFSTLYTSLPQVKLMDASKSIISKAFENNKFLITNGYKTYWSSNQVDKGYICFTCKQFIDTLLFLIQNSYLNFGDKIFLQVVGIPMGANYSPLIADLFLFYCEYQFMALISKQGCNFKFNYITRYIDDVAAINCSTFHAYLKDIYPPELEITCTSTSDNNIQYLDLSLILLQDHQINFTVFDKRDNFDFAIINFPFSSSNIPMQILYAVYISQLYRFARCCSSLNFFKERHKLLVSKLLNQGYNKSKLQSTFNKFISKTKHCTNYLPINLYINNINSFSQLFM